MTATEKLNRTFMTMIQLQTTCVGANDPIQESYEELVEGLRLFHERFNIRVFIDDYLDIFKKVLEYEDQIEELRPKVEEMSESREILEEDICTRAQMTTFLRTKYNA